MCSYYSFAMKDCKSEANSLVKSLIYLVLVYIHNNNNNNNSNYYYYYYYYYSCP